MDQGIRNELRNVVTRCRKLLEEAVSQVLQGQFGIYASGKKDEVHVEGESRMKNLSEEDKGYRRDIQAHLGHIEALGYKAKDSLAQLVREIAFTHLNRLCAYEMMEARAVWIGGKPFRESVSRGMKSQGFLFYLADHAEDKKLFDTGHQDVAYRHFLGWLGVLLSEEIGVLFSPTDPANRLFPPQRVLDDVLALLNSDGLKDMWTEDETIGWVYQYFTPKELRDQVRKESAAPRNSYELAFRNQFFTPRYVVEFLTDNTLGRIWYEMRKGKTKLKEQCRYMVRRPNEVFLADPVAAARFLRVPVNTQDIPSTVDAAFRGDFANSIGEEGAFNQWWIGLVVQTDQYEAATGHPFKTNYDHPCVTEVWHAIHNAPGGSINLHPLKVLVALSQFVLTPNSGGPYAAEASQKLWKAFASSVKVQAENGDLSQEELLKQPVCIPFRPKKDPRELRMLDPACGSGHFLLYCFYLLLTIYEEAYSDPDLGPKLKEEYPTLEALRRDVPRLILAHNLHGIDIDLRATQIAALALWLRCQRAYGEMGLKKDRPKITKSNIVCAEPMPGEREMLDEFLKTLKKDRLEDLIGRVMQVPEGSRVRATESMVESLNELVRLVWDKMQLAGEAGSLLKIEEELQEAVRTGQEEWEEKLPLFRFTEFSLTEKPKESYVRFVPGEGVSFWQRAEALVLEALRDYARHAANGGRLQRQLFVDDAAQGFAFIDTCQKRFDVVLMNPPFGGSSLPAKGYVEQSYPRAKKDMYATFVERALQLSDNGGFVGAITSRSGFFLSSMQRWREEVLLQDGLPTVIADLGQGVLDTAMVETAAYCVTKAHERDGRQQHSVFFSLLSHNDKASSLAHTTESIREGSTPSAFIHVVDPTLFRQVPGSPFAYWVSGRILRLWSSLPTLEKTSVHVCSTNPLNEDFRYFRLWWEVAAEGIGRTRRWVDLAKGGDFSRYYSDVHLLAAWDDTEETYRGFTGTVNRPLKRPASVDWFFKAGLTYSRRSQIGFSMRVLPSHTIFHDKGPGLFPSKADELLPYLGLLNSAPFCYLLNMQVSFGSYEVGALQRTPVPEIASVDTHQLSKLVLACIEAKREVASSKETTHVFDRPALLQMKSSDLSQSHTKWCSKVTNANRTLDENQRYIDDLSFRFYGINGNDRTTIQEGMKKHNVGATEELETEDTDESGIEWESLGRRDVVADLISYFTGCVLGRWDVQLATGVRRVAASANPFDSLPVCSTGMLKGPDGLPSANTPNNYPLRIDWDGIIPDDPDHSNDIVRRMQAVLELIWKDRAEAIEKGATGSSTGRFWGYQRSQRRFLVIINNGSSRISVGRFYNLGSEQVRILRRR